MIKTNGGVHTTKKSTLFTNNYLLNPIKLDLEFKKKLPKKTVIKNKDVTMGNTGSRKSSRAVKKPKQLEVGFKKTAPKSSYVPIAYIPEKIKEYENLIEKKRIEIKKYEDKISELRIKKIEAETKAKILNDVSTSMSKFKF